MCVMVLAYHSRRENVSPPLQGSVRRVQPDFGLALLETRDISLDL